MMMRLNMKGNLLTWQIVVIWVCLLLPLRLLAQEALSLPEAIGRGLDNNFALRIAEVNTEIAGINNNWGTAGRYPRLDLGVDASLFRSGNPGSFIAGRENASSSLALNWTLFDGYRVQATKARFELLETQSLGNAAIVVENTIQAIVLGYYEVKIAEEQLAVLRIILNNSRERLTYEQFRKDLGSGGSFELLQFQTNVINDSINLISQELALRVSQRNLNLVMQEPVESRFQLTDSVDTGIKDFVYEDMEQAMGRSNRSLRNQFLNQRLRAQESRLAKADFYPTVGINSNVTYAGGRILRRNFDPNTSEQMPTIPANFNAFDYTAGISVDFVLFNGGNFRRQLEVAQLNEAVSKLETDELKQNLSNELLVQWDNYQARQQILSLQNLQMSYTSTNLEIGTERFQAGLINSLDYRSLQLQYRNAQLSRLQALRDLKETETELIRLTGGFVQEE
jgi:outer membrane protein TolC